jgi:serine protease AprX
MKNRALIAAVSAYFLINPLANATEAAVPLQVMLQGGPAPELRILVENHGGTITHDLPIINAVGALLTPTQLEDVLESPLVERHIDDLSVEEAPNEGHQKSCDVGGALELDIDSSGIQWTLYNKKSEPATLYSLGLSWPESLGRATHISLDGIPIDPALYHNTKAGSLKIQLKQDRAPALTGVAGLKVSFKQSPLTIGKKPLQQHDFTAEVEFNGGCKTKLIPGYENNHENYTYNKIVGADSLHLHGVTGKGVTVAILDSGLWEHPALAKDTSGNLRVIARYDAIRNSTKKDLFDESGHGTHMASVIANSDPVIIGAQASDSFKGVAPDVNLVAVKALDMQGQGGLLDIVRGVQWVVNNRELYGIQVLNLSIAAKPRWHYWDDPINQAVMRAWDSGITVVASAGNEGPGPMTIGSPGNLPYIITVGAVTDSWTQKTRDDDYIPDFSSRGPTPSAHIKPDIIAPGGHITGLTRPGATLTTEYPEYILKNGELVMTGSSQASAVVSGIVALLLQLEPNLSPNQIKCKLITSAEPAINLDGLLAYSPFEQGHGLVSATRAITLGQKDCGNTELDIELDMSGIQHFQGPAIVEPDGSVTLPGLNSIVSQEPSEKGLSATRKWGVKDHIERITPADLESTYARPLNWQHIYSLEKSTLEEKAQESVD